MLGRAAAENIDLALALNDLAMATNRLYGRSNLHNISPKKTSSSKSASRAAADRPVCLAEKHAFSGAYTGMASHLLGKKIPQTKRDPVKEARFYIFLRPLQPPHPDQGVVFTGFFVTIPPMFLTRYSSTDAGKDLFHSPYAINLCQQPLLPVKLCHWCRLGPVYLQPLGRHFSSIV